MEVFYTIQNRSGGVYRESGSKFISVALPVTREEEINDLLNNYRRKYHDATHHCYAYVLNGNPLVLRSSDAGEPKHSAGDPILNQIRSFDLCNVLVIVIRYFGGTKLGIPGLINAYKLAARDALRNAEKTEVIDTETVKVQFDPGLTGGIMNLIRQSGKEIVAYQFEGSDRIVFKIRRSNVEMFRQKLKPIGEMKIT